MWFEHCCRATDQELEKVVVEVVVAAVVAAVVEVLVVVWRWTHCGVGCKLSKAFQGFYLSITSAAAFNRSQTSLTGAMGWNDSHRPSASGMINTKDIPGMNMLTSFTSCIRLISIEFFF